MLIHYAGATRLATLPTVGSGRREDPASALPGWKMSNVC